MNRKNLTAALLAALAGVAGIAGTAQAVNVNPDGVGQVLIYPYFTTNDGNQTILTVVNTTDHAKAVKVRFLEGYNSREVLDFNLYLSEHDVWVAAITELAGVDGGQPGILVPDTSCTVPYLYGMGGVQEFLPYAYTGDFTDGGPTDMARQSEGYFQVIEMGTLTDASERAPGTLDKDDPGRVGSATAATHVVQDDGSSMPLDCDQLVRNWTDYDVDPDFREDPLDGMWFDEAQSHGDCTATDPDDVDTADCMAYTDTLRNSGGLFGGAAVVNSGNGTMFSYNAKAIQGYDKSLFGLHYVPGTIHPSLNDGDQHWATIFFGTPSNEAVSLFYGRSVDAISALFMHDNVMNEYVIEEDLDAATEWVFNFPTKNWYVDKEVLGSSASWVPDPTDPGCGGWKPGEPFPPWDGEGAKPPGWELCTYLEIVVDNDAIPPFTEVFDGEACEVVGYSNWDREESPSTPGTPGSRPPVVSPAPPGGSRPDTEDFVLCYEVNVLRFGDEDIFGTTSDLLATVEDTPSGGWANVNFSYVADFKDGLGKIERHQDRNGLVGLPVIGFAAEEFENGFVGDGTVLANYGGLFEHRASVKRIDPDLCYHNPSHSSCSSTSP